MLLYREFTHSPPTSAPVATQAYVAEREGAWRLVMFPGTPSRKYLFERMLRRAPLDLETALVMRPGFERGAARPFLDFDDQVKAASPFLSGDKKVVTLGVSYGGQLALKAALDHQGVVAGAVTVAALITEPRAWVQPFVDLGGAPLVRNLLPRTLHHSRAEVAGRRGQIGPLFARLKDYRRPVTILHGDLDHLVGYSDAETLKAYFAADADVEIERVRGGTHFLEMQAPERLFAAVRRVIARAESRAKRAA